MCQFGNSVFWSASCNYLKENLPLLYNIMRMLANLLHSLLFKCFIPETCLILPRLDTGYITQTGDHLDRQEKVNNFFCRFILG